mgnify:FL=1|jgi:uncharacterized pyridoxamine 5'-phosphate oxidase family protein
MSSAILDRLRNDEDYYGAFGKQYLSNSDIGALLKNPKEFGQQSEDNVNYAKGRYFHQLILEPEKAKDTKFVDVSTRTTKAYKEFISENNISFAMLEKEGEEIRGCVDNMIQNLSFFEGIRQEGNLYEVPAIKEIHGMWWKGKADIVCDDKLIDLKTTSNIFDFKWSARKYNYDSQCFIYQELFGKPLVFYVVDKTNGMLGIYRPTQEFIKRGEEKVIAAIEVYKKFFGDNPTELIEYYYIDELL